MSDFSLILEHSATIAGAVKRTVRGISRHDHEDLCQDITIALVTKLKSFNPERGSIKSFIGQIAHNMAIDWTRSKRRDPDALPEHEPADLVSETPAEALMVAQENQAMRAALDTLTPSMRQFALDMIRLNLNVAAYSAETGVKTETVYTRLCKVRAKLAGK